MAADATCILDTAFGAGAAFLRAWQDFADALPRPAQLHYVGLIELGHWPLDFSAIAQATSAESGTHTHALIQALGALSIGEGPSPGFYRLPFDQGRVLLTLCLGPRDASLAQLVMQADHIVLGGDQVCTASELHSLQALARRGTTLAFAGSARQDAGKPALDAALWKPRGAGTRVFDPAWTLRSSRTRPVKVFEKPAHCTVIGAGISGAMVARTLALRGWQVTVLEQHAQAGAGASGLPAGLVSASGNSPADPLYGLTRSAYHLMRQMLHSMLVQSEDWGEGGAMRAYAPIARRRKTSTGQFALSPDAAGLADTNARSPWRAEALWLKPQALIHTCLSTPGVTLQCEAAVQRLNYEAGQWQALDARGHAIASSELLVLCNAMDAARLLAKTDEAPADILSSAARRSLTQLRSAYGSISSGPAADLPRRPALPVQGHGHFLPAVPDTQGLQWLAGAGFEADDSASEADCHKANLARIAQMLPDVSPTLQAQYEAGQVGLWRGQRCVSHDRLPLVGPATTSGESGLWMCLAMGARGLTFAALCAQLLAARLMAEPLPLPKRLARLLDVQRLQGRGS